jgi:hypothetical protein
MEEYLKDLRNQKDRLEIRLSYFERAQAEPQFIQVHGAVMIIDTKRQLLRIKKEIARQSVIKRIYYLEDCLSSNGGSGGRTPETIQSELRELRITLQNIV